MQDPDGVQWEVYHLNYDLEDEDVVPNRVDRTAGLTLAKTSACCAPSSASA